MSAEVKKGINLMPPGQRVRRKREAAARRWLAAGVAEAVVIGAAAVGLHWVSRVDDRSVRGEIVRVGEEQAQIEGRRADRTAATALVRQQMELRDRVNAPADYSKMLGVIAEGVGDEGMVTSMKWDVAPAGVSSTSAAAAAAAAEGKPFHPDVYAAGERLQVQLNGLVRSQAAVTRVVERIEKSGVFDEVRLVKSGRDGYMGGEAFSFQITCVTSGGGVK